MADDPNAGSAGQGGQTQGAGGDGGQAQGAADQGGQSQGAATQPHWAEPLNLGPDRLGFLKTKGLADLPATVDSLIAAERAIGADKLALPPKDKDGKRDWSKFAGWDELGRPKDAAGYGVDAVTWPDGVTAEDFDKAALGEFAKGAHAAGLTKGQMDFVLGFYGQHVGGLKAGFAEATERKAEAAHEALTKLWGHAHEKNAALAARAIKDPTVGGGPELVAALKANGLLDKDGSVLDANIADYFFKVGAKLAGETGGLGGGQGGGTQTPAQAEAEHNKMLADTFKAQATGESHPGWDPGHPEYKQFQEKAKRLLAMMEPPKAADAA